MNPLAGAKTTVARRLILRLAVIGVFLALVVAAFQCVVDYRADWQALEDRMAGIEHAYLPSIAENAWLNDFERLEIMVTGIRSLPGIAFVEIVAPDNRVIVAQGEAPAAPLTRTYPIAHEYQARMVPLGELRVTAGLETLRDAAIDRLSRVLGSNLVLLLGLAALLYLQVSPLVTGRLARIAAYARRLGHDGPARTPPLAWDDTGPSDDEFAELGHTLNRMRTTLAEAYDAVTTSEARYRELFTRSPVALWEQDFSAVRMALDEVRPSVAKLGPWLDQHPEFIRHCAQLVGIIDVNDASLALHRAADRGELARLSAVFTPTTYGAFRRQIEAIWEGRHDLTLATEIRTLEGDILDATIRWHVLPTHRETFARVIVSCEDVTELKTAQRSAEITLEKLMQANAELERFTFGASHDLQEPVRSIISFSQLLERHMVAQGSISSEAAEYLSFLKAAANRMQLQVSGLLDYARAGQNPPRFVPVALADALADASAMMEADLSGSGAKIEVGALPVVSGDRHQLAELFHQLLDNALKFRRPDQVPIITVTASSAEGLWRITMRDNGIGIDPLYALGVFDVFRRLHGPGQFPGAGIGLSICRRIVERHGGEIAVDTTCRDGAALVFTLPASMPAAAAAPTELASAAPAL